MDLNVRVQFLLTYFSHLGCPKTAYENVMNGGLAKSVNLHNGGKTTTKVSSKKYNCSLHGYYFDYSGFQVQWERVTNDVFELTIGSESQKNFIIQVTSHYLILLISDSFQCHNILISQYNVVIVGVSY